MSRANKIMNELIQKKLRFPEDFINKIILGDALDLIKLIPDNSADVVLTDPLYELSKDGIRNDADLTTFYRILPECYRVLKVVSLLPFSVQSFCQNYLKIIHSNISSAFVFKKGDPEIPHLGKDIFVDTPGKMVEPDEDRSSNSKTKTFP